VVVAESKLQSLSLTSVKWLCCLFGSDASLNHLVSFTTFGFQNLRGKDKIRHGLVFVGSGLKMANTDPLVHRLAGPSSGKAGLARDQTEINKVIAETSKGSKYYEVGNLSASNDT